ncbi:MAG TPA: sigma-54-dependent Fis family transcriptional regulator [Alphaproteobacteria bacterium]|jgi:two-component system, NtrC family, nitrogen regulation response regulator NtrX|nr:sigma-54-dependent Fis family transcriptional regulator [Alphaproteobacteria bacterium]
MARDILVVDDEADIRELISGILSDEGFQPRSAGCSDSALASIAQRRPSLVLLDIWLEGSKLDGLQLMERLRRDDPDLPIVVISGHGNVEVAVSAIKNGAYDFIEKPFQTDHLLVTINRAIEAFRLKRENRELRQMTGGETQFIGESSAAGHLRQTIAKVAATGSRVMIQGAAGSGKEVVARLLHEKSSRAAGPFVIVNAANMAPERMEMELFGAEAVNGGLPTIGLFERAHGGTLYLDEVGDMPLATQGKILRILVDQKFERIGGRGPVQVDVRVVSSTGTDLREKIHMGAFREDLFHRLNVVPIRVPSLAERREDIPQLIEYLVQRISSGLRTPPRRLTEDAIATLQTYDWPGNVRQLRNVLERLIILAPDNAEQAITAEMLPAELGASTPLLLRAGGGGSSEVAMSLPLREAREMFERDYLIAQIGRFGGNISRTAAFIGMERSALHRKLKSLGAYPNSRGEDEPQ